MIGIILVEEAKGMESISYARALRGALLALSAACMLVLVDAPAARGSDYMTAAGCPHHQAFVAGDGAAVDARLPDAYTPVRTVSGAPLLFVRAIHCDVIGVGGKTGPGTMATYGVVVDSPDGLGCASTAPVIGAVYGELPPICNWYLMGWIADRRRVVEWLRDQTPGVPATHVRGLEFELGEFDPSRGGAPFRFRTPASAPAPFAIDAIGRERPGEIPVRGGYWVDTPEGTVKLVFFTQDLSSGDASGVVSAPAGSLLSTLMGAEQRSYEPEFSSFSAERWNRASYRKQNLAAAPSADSLGGSCSFEGNVSFDPPATNIETRDVVYSYDGTGTCTGTLNGREISEVPASVHQSGPARARCSEAQTTDPGHGAISFSSGETIRATLDFRSQQTEVDLMYFGERSGYARGHASFLTDRTPPDVVQRCSTPEGVAKTPLDVMFTTESPLVSEPPRKLAHARHG